MEFVPATLLFLLLLLLFLRLWLFNPHVPLDHVNFLSGSLGTGKTSLAVYLARLYSRRRRVPIIANIEIAGAEPLDTGEGVWPTKPAIIVLDEILLLEANGILPYPWLAVGLTMARQYGQTVIILCQTHRPPFPKKFWGTIGQWMVVRSFGLGPLGRFVMLRRSPDPFVRMLGWRGHDVRRHFFVMPRWVFSCYTRPIRIVGIERVLERLVPAESWIPSVPEPARLPARQRKRWRRGVF